MTSSCAAHHILYLLLFFFNHPAPPQIYTLSLHDALPISIAVAAPIASLPRVGPCFVVSIGTWPTPRSKPLVISVVLDSPRSATCWSPSYHPNSRTSHDTSLSPLRIAAAVRAPRLHSSRGAHR